MDTTGLTGKESRRVVELFFNTIRETLASGEELKLSGFGNFHIREVGYSAKYGDQLLKW